MTDRAVAAEGEVPGFPAPGSVVPGAPPALKRALVPADGVPFTSPTAQDGPAATEHHASVPWRGVNVASSPLIAAAAMLGIALGLELAGLSGSWRRTRRNSSHVLT